MLKKYTKPEMTIATWDTEDILTASSNGQKSLKTGLGGDSSYRYLGSKKYSSN